MKRQLERLDIVSRAYYSDNLGLFCEELAELAGLDACLPMNTGAEAVETAIKAARRYGYDRLSIPEGQAEIIVAEGNFHGRTTTHHRLFERARLPARVWPFRAGLRHRAVWRRGGA